MASRWQWHSNDDIISNSFYYFLNCYNLILLIFVQQLKTGSTAESFRPLLLMPISKFTVAETALFFKDPAQKKYIFFSCLTISININNLDFK